MSERVTVFWHGRDDDGTPYVSDCPDPTVWARTFQPFVLDEEGPWAEVAEGGGLLPGLWDYWRADQLMVKRDEYEMEALEVGDNGAEPSMESMIDSATSAVRPNEDRWDSHPER